MNADAPESQSYQNAGDNSKLHERQLIELQTLVGMALKHFRIKLGASNLEA